jgi:gliding motility-associated-like protein
MFMRKFYLSLFLLLSMFMQAKGQYENNVWIFGHGAGLDFNSGSPVPITSSMSTESGCASASSHSGALLFYTNGQSVWNNNNTTMPNGTGLLGLDANNTYYGQGAMIVPFVNDTNKYYIFSLNSNYENDLLDNLYYSVVDMSLNNGTGDVVAGQKNIWLANGLGSAMKSVAGDNCNIWVLTHSRDTNVFHAFEVNAAGVSTTPVTSTVGTYSGTWAYRTAMMNTSPTRHKIALSNFTISLNNGIGGDDDVASAVEAYDFNPATGVVSNAVLIDWTTDFFLNYLGVCFSPDGSKLYATNPFNPLFGIAGVVQYDLSLGNLKTGVGFSPFCSDLRIGPDNKLYVDCGLGGAALLDVIDDPNVSGIGCNYNTGAIVLSPGTMVTGALPSPIVYPIKDTTINTHNASICNGNTLQLQAPGGFFYYYFQGAAVADTVVSVNTPGTYYFVYEDYCQYMVDTYHVDSYELSSALNDTAICAYDFAYTLDATANNVPGTQFRWQDNSTGPIYTATLPGVYWVEMTVGGCLKTDTFTLEEKQAPHFNLGNDTTICTGDVLTLEGPLNVDSYSWQDGSGKNTFDAGKPGIYSLTISLDNCYSSDTLSLSTDNCDCIAMIPNAFSPNGDGNNDKFLPVIQCANLVPKYNLSIYNRFGQRIFYSNKQDNGWNGTYNGAPAELGTYYYVLEFSTRLARQATVKKGDITLIR